MLRTRRILIVEDDTFLAIGLESTIMQVFPAEIVLAPTVAVAERELTRPQFDFAFLDVNVTDGKTYRIADILLDHGIRFAFVSGASRDKEMPVHLRHIPFLPKPYRARQIGAIVRKL
jgi:DNA-binding NtrC family response regulator